MNTAEILVAHKDLESALSILEVAVKGKNPPELVISCQPGLLTLQAGGSSYVVSGKGCLLGQTRLSGKLIKALKQTLPNDSEIVIGQQPGKISIGPVCYSCIWEIMEERTIHIPINASLGHILGVCQRYTDEEIDKSGYRPKFEAANQERVQRIAKALELLMPLGVIQEDLEKLVAEAIVRLNRDNL